MEFIINVFGERNRKGNATGRILAGDTAGLQAINKFDSPDNNPYNRSYLVRSKDGKEFNYKPIDEWRFIRDGLKFIVQIEGLYCETLSFEIIPGHLGKLHEYVYDQFMKIRGDREFAYLYMKEANDFIISKIAEDAFKL